jgi:hypothetical protein
LERWAAHRSAGWRGISWLFLVEAPNGARGARVADGASLVHGSEWERVLDAPEQEPDTEHPATIADPLDTVVALKLEGPPQPLDQSIKQSPDGTLTLLATDCDVHAQSAKLEKKGDHPYNIGYWTNLNDTVTWDTTITHPGHFTVTLEYSLGGPPPGSEIHLEFGSDKSKTLPIKLDPTKDFLDFKTIPAGSIDLPAGPITITLRPTKKSGVAVMDLRQITLKLADK